MVEYSYYCPFCDLYLTDDEVTGDHIQDPKCVFCDRPVYSPGYDEPYDTLEESWL